MSFDVTLEARARGGLKIVKVGQLKMPDLPAKDK